MPCLSSRPVPKWEAREVHRVEVKAPSRQKPFMEFVAHFNCHWTTVSKHSQRINKMKRLGLKRTQVGVASNSADFFDGNQLLSHRCLRCPQHFLGYIHAGEFFHVCQTMEIAPRPAANIQD